MHGLALAGKELIIVSENKKQRRRDVADNLLNLIYFTMRRLPRTSSPRLN